MDTCMQDSTLQLKHEHRDEGFQDFFPDSFLPDMKLASTMTQPENKYTVLQCDDGRGTLTIVKQEPPEDERSFCHELQLNCKTESMEISREEEEECDASLGEREELNLTEQRSRGMAFLPQKKRFTAEEALEQLQSLQAEESDGGSDFDCELESDSDTDLSDQEHFSPPAKKKSKPAPGIKAVDGTTWTQRDVPYCTGESLTAFTETSGPTELAKCKVTSRLQSFLCLIDIMMLRIIMDCTVREGRKADPTWNLSLSELMAFIAIIFLRAVKSPLGSLAEAWSEHLGVAEIKDTMPRDRYKDIMKHLRFDNKDTRAKRVKTDKFAAISNIWARFIENCVLHYNPGRHLTAGEQLFPTKSRCPFTQYVAKKQDKFGIKFWIAADLHSKFMCNASPYLGEDPKRAPGDRLEDSVVMKLMEPFLDKGRTVATDNFTSLTLAKRLLQRGTTLVGTIDKVRRELPPAAKVTCGREQYSTQLFTTDSALLTVYAAKKNKSVCILSSMHDRVKIGSDHKRKPNTVTDYNKLKCGVDILDQKVRAYSVRTQTRRWPVAVFYNMLDLAAMNAHVLYCSCTGSEENRRLFLALLAQELRGHFLQEKVAQKHQNKFSVTRPLPLGKKTTCQVGTRCNRNHSTKTCVNCNLYTCNKCRIEGPWLCNVCADTIS